MIPKLTPMIFCDIPLFDWQGPQFLSEEMNQKLGGQAGAKGSEGGSSGCGGGGCGTGGGGGGGCGGGCGGCGGN